MPETIREIYNNIYNIIFNSANNMLGQKIDRNVCANLENQIIYRIKYSYPQFDFKLNLIWDELNHSLNPQFELSNKYFPIMNTKNYQSHDFIDCSEGFLPGYNSSKFLANVLKCQKCNIKITESGSPIDEDLNCQEMIIKNIIE